jgi:hypothetical protein
VVPDEPSGSPVFVLAGGARTGSTLLQRLLISTGEIMIWGEHGGLLLAGLQRMVSGMAKWIEREGRQHWDVFRKEGWNNWIPNVAPPLEEFVAGARAALLRSLAVPAAQLGYPRWGFKEIRYTGGAVALLKKMFPDAVIVVLVRHPEAVLRSIKTMAFYIRDYRGRPDVFLGRWALASSSLARCCAPGSSVQLWRYEDIVADSEAAISSLAVHVGVDPARFDRRALENNIKGVPLSGEQLGPSAESSARGASGSPVALDDLDRAALASPEVRRVAAELGYGR